MAMTRQRQWCVLLLLLVWHIFLCHEEPNLSGELTNNYVLFLSVVRNHGQIFETQGQKTNSFRLSQNSVFISPDRASQAELIKTLTAAGNKCLPRANANSRTNIGQERRQTGHQGVINLQPDIRGLPYSKRKLAGRTRNGFQNSHGL